MPAPSPVKRLFIGVKQPSPQSNPTDRYPLRLRTPDLSNCHVCNSPINPNNKTKKGNKNNFQTLDSQWRIVIICNSCFINLQSAKSCSYCFNQMKSGQLGVNCHCCNRCVHRDCLPMYAKLNFCSDLDLFTCIDCWNPRTINRKRVGNQSNKENLKCDKSLEDAAKDAEAKAEMKRVDAAKSREKALEKAARRATETAAGALDLAVIGDDAELALRLHRAINSSRRIFKNMESVGFEKVVHKKERKINRCSLSACSGPTIRIDSVVDDGTDVLTCENPDKPAPERSTVEEEDLKLNGCSVSDVSQIISVFEAGVDHLTSESSASEPALQVGNSDHSSSNDLVTLDRKRKMESRDDSGNDEPDSLTKSERVLDAGHVKISDSGGWIPAREKLSRCSSMVTGSSGNYVNKESVSRCLHQGVLTYKRGTQFRSSYSVDITLLQKQSCNGRAMNLRKYNKRCHSGSMYIRKYCRRRTNSKHIFDPSTNCCANTFQLKSETSGTVQMNNTEVLTSTETCFQHPYVPSQASTSV